MPDIKKLQLNPKKLFKKRDYRPYNLEGINLNEQFKTNNIHCTQTLENVVLEVEPKKIRNWKFHDRPLNELGNISSLAKEFLSIGQQIPCVVREITGHSNFQYELIAGERRWRAAHKAGTQLKVLIRNLSDNEAALVQISENSNRSAISDYAKGLSYSKLIENNILSQSDLVEKLKISKQQISKYLSFNKIPATIRNALGDMSKISAGTAEQIKQLSIKGDDYINAIIHYAAQITEGKIGKNKLVQLVEAKINQFNNLLTSEKVYSINKHHLYTWKNDTFSVLSIHFPRNITSLIVKGQLDKNLISNSLKQLLENMLMNIK